MPCTGLPADLVALRHASGRVDRAVSERDTERKQSARSWGCPPFAVSLVLWTACLPNSVCVSLQRPCVVSVCPYLFWWCARHGVHRGDTVLRSFDPALGGKLAAWMEHAGIHVHRGHNVMHVQGLAVYTDKGERIGVDELQWAMGRHANTEGLGLEGLGVTLDAKGDVMVDEWQESSVRGIYALGDVCGRAQLTPVAAERRLSNRLYGPESMRGDRPSYENVPTVVFS
ncbi:hypothetical protein AcW1_005311 [Taiwanofungus camphoratus]|nr:hypothetical protein AcW1_005311 [Antrodia cinnamomea]